jgi:hypothetical protein
MAARLHSPPCALTPARSTSVHALGPVSRVPTAWTSHGSACIWDTGATKRSCVRGGDQTQPSPRLGGAPPNAVHWRGACWAAVAGTIARSACWAAVAGTIDPEQAVGLPEGERLPRSACWAAVAGTIAPERVLGGRSGNDCPGAAATGQCGPRRLGSPQVAPPPCRRAAWAA